MSSIMAPNVPGVSTPGRRTVYSMCGMCAVRCPMEVTVEDGRVVWLQGNAHDKAIGASLCAKGAAGLALEYDDERPQTPLIRMGPRGGGQCATISGPHHAIMRVGLFSFPVRFSSLPPIDLASLSAYLKGRGHEVYARDFNAELPCANDCDGAVWASMESQQDLLSRHAVSTSSGLRRL